jgi:hypothetical protein
MPGEEVPLFAYLCGHGHCPSLIRTDGAPFTLHVDGVLRRRFEIQNPNQEGVKIFFYSDHDLDGSELAVLHDIMASEHYDPNCGVCGKPVRLRDDVMPYDLIDGVPVLRHMACTP